MKNQLEILNALEINLDLFYCISFREYEIRLQGIITDEAVRECNNLVKLQLDHEMNWLTGTIENITITLTF